MENLSGTAIFWFISLGITVGWLFGYYIKKEGRSMNANMTWGTAGALVVGSMGIVLGFGDGLLFAFMGTLAVLFIANVFHQHHEEDTFGHVDKGINNQQEAFLI
ncbi:MAG: hypothetical protein U5K69_08105 [Balneolaceae bacterium]|nr:hypothetical protein [Balneolaceae bacterium]